MTFNNETSPYRGRPSITYFTEFNVSVFLYNISNSVCGETEGTCGQGGCYPDTETCNYRAFCLDETDEMSCPGGM